MKGDAVQVMTGKCIAMVVAADLRCQGSTYNITFRVNKLTRLDNLRMLIETMAAGLTLERVRYRRKEQQ